MTLPLRVLFDDPTANYTINVSFTEVFSSENVILILVDGYKPDSLKIGYGEGFPEIFWNEGIRINSLKLPYKGWGVFSAMPQRDGISVALTNLSCY